MTNLLIQAIEKKFINKKTPILRPGYQVRVHQKIKEGNKERIQVFEGLVIGLNAGHGSSKTFTVRKVVQGIGVEKIFPVYSPNIAKVEIKKTFKARRSKLTYLKKAGGLSKRLSAKLGLIEKDEIMKQKKGLQEQQEATLDEAVMKAQEDAKAEAEAAGEDVNDQAVVENAAAVVEEKAEAPVKKEAKAEEKVEAAVEEAPAVESAPSETDTKVKTEAELQEKEKTE